MSTRLLKVEEAAERLSYSTRTVKNLIASGRLRAVRLGGEGSHWRVPEDAIPDFIASLEDNAPTYRLPASLQQIRSRR